MASDLGYAILLLVLYVLAVARLTRLINADTILDRPRLWIASKARSALLAVREAQSLGQTKRAEVLSPSMRRWQTAMYFVQCPWCVGLWLSLAGAVVPVRLVGWPWWAVFPVALAASHLVGVFAFAADTEDMDIEDDNAD